VPESSQRLIDFIDNHYLPEAKKILRPSTFKGYKDIVKLHLRKRLGDIRVRDFRTVHVQRPMAQIPNVGHRTLLRIRATLSDMFTFALRTGRDRWLQPDARCLGSWSTEEVQTATLQPGRVREDCQSSSPQRRRFRRRLDRQVCWATGIGDPRPSVADFDGNMLRIKRSVWRTQVGPTKTEESEAPVPVIPALCLVLETHKRKVQSKAGERKGMPLNLHNLANRLSMPALKEKGLEWKGWKAWRAGLASALYSLKVPPKVIAAILRHDPLTSWKYYIDAPSEVSVKAMQVIEVVIDTP
jgi:hypothetical protein